MRAPDPTDAPPGTAVARPGAVLAAGSMAANVLAYLLGVIGAHRLGPDAYGELGALLGLLVVGSVPATAVQAVTARRVAAARLLPAAGEAAAARAGAEMLRVTAGLAVAVTAVVLAAAPALVAFLHVPALAVAGVAVTLAPTTLIGGLQGWLQGGARFASLAGLFVAAAGGRVAGTLAGLLATGSVAVALAGGAVASLAVAAVGWRRCAPAGRGPEPAVGDRLADCLHATGALLGFFVLANVDVLLARHRLPAGPAGLYAAGAIVAKAALWLPQVVTVLAFPRLVGDGRRRTLRLALGAVLAVEAVTAAVAWLAAPLAVRLVGGPGYRALTGAVPVFALLGGALAAAQLLVLGRLAVRSRAVTGLVWAAVAAQVLLLTVVVPGTVTGMVTGSAAAAGGLVVATLAVEWRASRRADAADGLAAAERQAVPAGW